MRKTAVAVAMLAIAVAVFLSSGALASIRMDAFINERLVIPDDGQAHEFVFTSTANNLYDFRSFGGGDARATLYEFDGEEPLTNAVGFSFTYRLNADTAYVLSVEAPNGPCEVEIMRSTLGRSFSKPIVLDRLDTGYDKAIARAYDTHWYKFTSPVTGLYTVTSVSEINLVGYLLDSEGVKIAMSDNLYSPYSLDFRITRNLTAGESYYIRVSGRGGETGKYGVYVSSPKPGEVMPEEIYLSDTSITLDVGGRHALGATFEPDNSIREAVWLSSDASVASVDQDGVVTARSAGTAWIILSGLANVEGRCQITVNPMPVSGVSLDSDSYEMLIDEALTLSVKIEPENATNKNIILTSSDPDIVEVGRRTTIVARGVGTATITATSVDGDFSSVATVTVSPSKPVYRALVMAQQKYADGRTRTGAINTAQGIVDMLINQSQNTEITMKLDTTRSQAILAIREAFSSAKPADVSLLYLSSHGGLTGGKAWIEFHDGKRLTSRQLERELRKIKGVVVLLIDSCQSGAFISTDCRAFNSRLIESFSPGSSTRLISSKYRILASSCSSQDSYRFSADGENSESSMATAFGRALGEAGGWDIIGDRKTVLRGDLNGDHIVSLHEAWLYASRRVRQFLARSSAKQDVQIYPSGSQFQLIFR